LLYQIAVAHVEERSYVAPAAQPVQHVEGPDREHLSARSELRLELDDLAVEEGVLVFAFGSLGRDLEPFAGLESLFVDPAERRIGDPEGGNVGKVQAALHGDRDRVSHELDRHRLAHALYLQVELADQVLHVSHWESPGWRRARAVARGSCGWRPRSAA